MKKSLILIAGLMLCVSPVAFSQAWVDEVPLGEFTHQVFTDDNWSTNEDNSFADGTYEILASGNDIWGSSDGMTFVCKEVAGSFEATATFTWGAQEVPGDEDPTAGNDWKKMGFMFRTDIEDAGSQYIIALLRNDGNAYFQLRPESGAGAEGGPERAFTEGDTGKIQVVRSGDTFIMNRFQEDGSVVSIGSIELDLPDPVFFGIAVTSHDVANLERAIVSDLTIEEIAVGGSVARTLPVSSVDGGGSITGISLGISIEEGKTAGSVVLTENVPEGWIISNIAPSAGAAELVDGSIVWTLSDVSGSDAVLTYDADVPGGFGEAAFGGTIVIGSKDFAISGDGSIAVLPPASNGLGFFEANQDIFELDNPDNLGAEGDARFDPATGTYVVMGSGRDIWDAADNFHFLYIPVTGNCSIKANSVLVQGTSGSTWAKVGLMIRDELEAESAFAFSMVRSEGRDWAPQWREAWGGGATWDSTNFGFIANGPDEGMQMGTTELVFQDDVVTMYYYDAATGDRVEYWSNDLLELIDENYIGLCVTSHEAGSISQGVFSGVSLTLGDEVVAVSQWSLY